MSVTDPSIMDIDYPPPDPAQVSPSIDDVALLEHTRTIDSLSNELGTFTSDTRPTDVEVTAVIAQASQIVLASLPLRFSPAAYGAVKQAIALQAAILIEFGFFRDQAAAGSTVGFNAAYDAVLNGVQILIGGGAGKGTRVDSPVMRGTGTDYDPYYPVPPPKVIVETGS